MPNLIEVTDTEWQAAKAFFDAEDERVAANAENQEPAAVKFKARDKAIHSFIRIGGEIFVMETKGFAGHLLGEGGFGKVRMVQTRNGDNFAVKIEGRGIRGENDTETKIMKTLNYLKGEAVKNFPSSKRFLNRNTRQKLYTVTKLIKGMDLYQEIDTRESRIKNAEGLSIALNVCKAVQVLHNHNIIHADIKPHNFMINREGEEILIESIDYGLSLIVTPPATQANAKRGPMGGVLGTKGYMADEVELSGIVSFSSDVYALGSTIKDFLRFGLRKTVLGELMKKMQDSNPDKRPKLDDIVFHFALAQAIESIDRKDALSAITAVFEQIPALEHSHYAQIALFIMNDYKHPDKPINEPISSYLFNKMQHEHTLEWASTNGNLELTKTLINDLKITPAIKQLVLESAIISKDIKSIKTLIQAGVLNIIIDPQSILNFAVEQKLQPDIIELMLAQGANLKLIDIIPIQEFTKKWQKHSIENTYLIENRNIIPKMNPLLHLFKQGDKISNTRKEQLDNLSGAIAALDSSKSSDKTILILNVFKTIGYIHAQLKNESNWLGSRLSKTLNKIETDLKQISPSSVTQDQITAAKQEGAEDYKKYKQQLSEDKAKKKSPSPLSEDKAKKKGPSP